MVTKFEEIIKKWCENRNFFKKITKREDQSCFFEF